MLDMLSAFIGIGFGGLLLLRQWTIARWIAAFLVLLNIVTPLASGTLAAFDVVGVVAWSLTFVAMTAIEQMTTRKTR